MNIILNIIHHKWIRLHVCTYSSMKSHYDTLEVSSKATKEEIKSSYYKLTMKYHPDKNKSELAKRKFQNISEAYEVLGNPQARKRYDRSMMVKQHEQREIFKSPPTPHASVYQSKNHPINNQYFNFDKWYEMHYREMFIQQQINKQKFIRKEWMNNPNKDKEEISLKPYIITFCITYLIIICTMMKKNYDKPLERVKKR